MMWPPQSVKIVSTPSLLSARATRWPPEINVASLLFGRSVSSAVLDAGAPAAGADTVLTALISPPASRNQNSATSPVARRCGGQCRTAGRRRSGHAPGTNAGGGRRQTRTLLGDVLDAAGSKVPHAHRLEDEQADAGGQQIEDHRDREYRVPALL